MKRFVTALAVTAALQAGAAHAAPSSTPAAYLAQLNAVCRSYTPRFNALEADMKRASQAKDGVRYGADLGRSLGLALEQDGRILRTPVPAPLRTRMAPIRRRLQAIDAHARRALQKAVQRDGAGMVAELQTVGRLAKPLNAMLDGAGLRDCGSNQ